MRLFQKLLLLEFSPFLILGVFFFALILVLGDIFSNLWQYLNLEVPFSQAIQLSLMYGPKALVFAMPIGAMFAAAFAFGNLGARNELIAVFGSGVSLVRFAFPMLAIAAILSVGVFVLEDRVAIPITKRRNMISNELLGKQDSKSRSDAVAISMGGRVIYIADYYDDSTNTLSNLTVIMLNEDYEFFKRIDAQEAVWSGSGLWQLGGCRIYYTGGDDEILQISEEKYSDELISENPDTFRLDTREVEEMTGKEARIWIATQKRTGLPYKVHQAKYYQRFTMALTPFLVVLFAGAFGSKFRRNILLVSLLASLGMSVAWYIVRMVATLFSELGILSPIAGSVLPYLGFLTLGAWMFKHAKT